MSAYFIRVPDLEPQTLIHYNEIFKEILKDMYNEIPRTDWIDANKYSLDRITNALPEESIRGNTIHYNIDLNSVCYGYSYKYLTSNHASLIEVKAGLEKCEFIGAI